MAVPAPGGIEHRYHKRKVVPITVKFQFRSGVSVQATSVLVLISVPVVVKCKFKSVNKLNQFSMAVPTPGGIEI